MSLQPIRGILQKPDDACETVTGQCRQHGDYTVKALWMGSLLVNPEPDCPECAEMVKFIEGLNEANDIEKAAEKRLRRRIGDSNIPLRIRQAEPYKPTTERAEGNLKAVKKYFDDFDNEFERGGNLILTGNPGTGKTHLAGRLGISLINNYPNINVVYGTASEILRHIRGAYARDAEYSEADALDKYGCCDLLIIDELGVKMPSDHDKSKMFEIVDTRYQNCRPTVVISNLQANELAEATDERMIDRLRHNGTLLIFDWDSYRGSA